MRWLKQPSTWRGIFLLIGLFGFHLRPELQEAIINAVVGVLALIEVIRNEHAPAPVHIQLPPVELIGRATVADRVRESVPARRSSGETDGPEYNGWADK